MKYISARAVKDSDFQSMDFLWINNCGAFVDLTRPMRTERPNGRVDFQLLYVSRGQLDVFEGDTERTCTAGNVVLFRPKEPQSYRVASGSTFYWIHFSGTAAMPILDFFRERVYSVGAFPEFAVFCEECVAQFAAQKPNYNLFCAGKLVSLIALLSQKCTEREKAPQTPIDPALLEMHRDVSLARTNDDYAKLCGLSKSHFIRLFTDCMGIPPQKYRTAIVMRAAKELLRSNSVGAVADLLGFSDVFYFSRLFKKHYGYSPKDYRTAQRA